VAPTNSHHQKGQSIVELSLMTPLLLVALYIPFDFGVSFFAAHLTQNAVREVARIASTQAPGSFNAASLQTELTNNRLPRNVTVVGTPSITKFVTTPANCGTSINPTTPLTLRVPRDAGSYEEAICCPLLINEVLLWSSLP